MLSKRGRFDDDDDVKLTNVLYMKMHKPDNVVFTDETRSFVVPVRKLNRFVRLEEALEWIDGDKDEDEVEDEVEVVHIEDPMNTVLTVFKLLDDAGLPKPERVSEFIRQLKEKADAGSKIAFDRILSVFDLLAYDQAHVSAFVSMMVRCESDPKLEFDRWRATGSKMVQNLYLVEMEKSMMLEHLILTDDEVDIDPSLDSLEVLYETDGEAYTVPEMRLMCRNIASGYEEFLSRGLFGNHEMTDVVEMDQRCVLRMISKTSFDADPPHMISAVVNGEAPDGNESLDYDSMEYGPDDVDPRVVYMMMDAGNPYETTPNLGYYFEYREINGVTDPAEPPSFAATPNTMRYFMYAVPIQVLALFATASKPFDGVYADTFMELYQRKMDHIRRNVECLVRKYAGKWRMVQMTHVGPMVVVYDLPVNTDGDVVGITVRDDDELDKACLGLPTSQADMYGGDVHGLSVSHEIGLRAVEDRMRLRAANVFTNTEDAARYPDLAQMDRIFFTPWGDMYFRYDRG